MKVQFVLNKMSAALGEDYCQTVCDNLYQEMQDTGASYRIGFPVCPAPLSQGVILLAPIDRRVRAMRNITIDPNADHIFIFLMYLDTAEATKQGNALEKFFPQQSQMSESLYY